MSNRRLEYLGIITNIDYSTFVYKKGTGGSEASFTVYKTLGENECEFWNELSDLSVIYIKEYDEFFETSINLNESDNGDIVSKSVTCTYLPIAELSQIYLYNVEINTQKDINRDDFTSPTVFYDSSHKQSSLLHRITDKISGYYSIGDVPLTVRNIQRTFSFNGVSIYDALSQIEKQIGCKFVIDSHKRVINVVDQYSTCNKCGYRGDFHDTCPKCGSNDVNEPYGEQTNVFISKNSLSSSASVTTNDSSLKTVFRLSTGDEDMDAAVINLNPNGSRYIYNFGTKVRSQFSSELAKVVDNYEKAYDDIVNEKDKNTIDSSVMTKYNDTVKKYNDSKYDHYMYDSNNDKILMLNTYHQLSSGDVSYRESIQTYYSALDFYQYLNSSLMPSPKIDMSTVEYQVSNIKKYANEIGIIDFDEEKTSISTVKSSVKLLFMSIINGAFKVEINSCERVDNVTDIEYNVGFTVSEYRDSTKSSSDSITITVKSDYDLFISQKVTEKINESVDEAGIYGIIAYDRNDDGTGLKNIISLYSMARLESFRDAFKNGIEVIDDDNYNGVFDTIKNFFSTRLGYINDEIKTRETEINNVTSMIDALEKIINDTHKKMDINNFLVSDRLKSEWMSFRREQDYTNTNFVSTDLDSEELINRAREFINLATQEIDRASREIYTINGKVNNLMLIPEFKDLWDKFDVFNWITYKVDDKVFRLRILSYQIEFNENSISTIDVEFSNAVEGLTAANPFETTKQILGQARSVSNSYNYIQYQTLSNTMKIKKLLDSQIAIANRSLYSISSINKTINNQIVSDSKFNSLNADVSTIDKLLAGEVTADTGKIIHLTANNFVADNGVITDLMVGNLSANKMSSGKINTNKVVIQSEDGGMNISGNTQQFIDKNNKVRMQIGKDNNGNFSYSIFDENGNTIFYEDGITKNAVPNGIIVDKMVADNANISGDKLDINSVVSNINNGEINISSSHIYLDNEKNTLNVVMENMKNTENENKQTISELKESSDGITQRISSTEKILSDSGIDGRMNIANIITETQSKVTDGAIVNAVKRSYDLDQMSTDISDIKGDVSSLESSLSSAESKITDDAIVSTVRKSETYKSDLAKATSDANTYTDSVKKNIDTSLSGKVDTTVYNSLASRVSNAESKITDTAIVNTVTQSQTYKNDMNEIAGRLTNAENKITDTAIVDTVTKSETYQNDIGTLASRLTNAENKITDTAIVNTVTKSEKYQNDITNINNKIESRIRFSDSEPSNPANGDIWINGSDGNTRYLWNGESWVDVSNTALDSFINDTYTTYVNQTADKIENAIGSIDEYGTRTSIIEQNIDSMMNQLSNVQNSLVGTVNRLVNINKITAKTKPSDDSVVKFESNNLKLGYAKDGAFELYKSENFTGLYDSSKIHSLLAVVRTEDNSSQSITIKAGNRTSTAKIDGDYTRITIDSISFDESKSISVSCTSGVYLCFDKLRLIEAERYVDIAEGITSLTNSVTQTQGTVEFISSQLDTLKSDIDGASETSERIKKYVIFNEDPSDASLTLCTSRDSSGKPTGFTMKLTPKALNFYQNYGDTEPIAYLTNSNLYITKAVVVQSFRIGHHIWTATKTDSGDDMLVLDYIGGNA